MAPLDEKDTLDGPDIGYAVPVHNGAEHLREALSSLAEQSVRPRKVYIFENGSTDDTLAIAQEFVDKYPNFELQASEVLLPAAENFDRAYAHLIAHHEFFALLAHDDTLAPNYVEELTALLEDNPDALLAVADVMDLSKAPPAKVAFDTRILDVKSYDSPKRGYKRIEFPASWYYGIYRGQPALDVMADAKRKFPYLWGGDRLQVLHFLLRGKLVYSSKTHFNWRPGSASFQKLAERRASKMLVRRIQYHRAMWAHRRMLRDSGMRGLVAFWFLCFETASRDTYRLEPLLLGKYRKMHARR